MFKTLRAVWDKSRTVFSWKLGVAIVLSVSMVISGGMLFLQPDTHNYQYTVKTEQVNEQEMIENEEAVAYENLSSKEQEIIFSAFKQSDHFLGGASVTIMTDTRMETLDTWRLVEVRGVPILVAVTGPEKIETTSSSMGNFGSIIMSLIGVLIMFGISIEINHRLEHQ